MNKITNELLDQYELIVWKEQQNSILNELEYNFIQEIRTNILRNQKIVNQIITAKQDMVKILSDPNTDIEIVSNIAAGVLEILNHITDDE